MDAESKRELISSLELIETIVKQALDRIAKGEALDIKRNEADSGYDISRGGISWKVSDIDVARYPKDELWRLTFPPGSIENPIEVRVVCDSNLPIIRS